MPRPTLIVHTICFRPDVDREKTKARELGCELYELLTRPLNDPLVWGAGVNVRIATHPEHVAVDEAELVCLIPVLGEDSHAHKPSRERVIEKFATWTSPRAATADICLAPVFLDEQWRQSEARLPTVNVLTDLYVDRGSTLDRLVRLIARFLHRGDKTRTWLFISHAKADLAASQQAARYIDEYIKTGTDGHTFFDETSLVPGQDQSIGDQIDLAALSHAFVAIRGDQYSARAWCQREVFEAKRHQVPTLVVEVIKQGEPRSNPYLGNVPTLRWSGPDERPLDTAPHSEHKEFEREMKRAAAEVVRRATIECVRHALFAREAERLRTTAQLPNGITIAIARPPELLDLPDLPKQDILTRPGSGPTHREWDPNARITVLHPDPELSAYEHNLLRRSMPRLRLLTPTTALRGSLGDASDAPLGRRLIALSLADSPQDVEGTGVEPCHARDAVVYLARSLVALGASIGYAGDFRRRSGQSVNYVDLLSELITKHNQTTASHRDLLYNYVPASVDPPRGDEAPPYTRRHLREGELASEAALEPPVTVDLPEHRKALYVSDMRRVMNLHIEARIILGGPTHPLIAGGATAAGPAAGYRGRYPGIVEEAWRTIDADGQTVPLYACGGYGGSAALVAELLDRGRREASAAAALPDLSDRPDTPDRLREDFWWSDARAAEIIGPAGVERFRSLCGALDRDGDQRKLGLPAKIDDMARDLVAHGAKVLASDAASLHWNGLSIDENLQLFRSRDPLVIACLVLRGLLKIEQRRPAASLRVDLVHGDVTALRNVELIILPAFEDLEMTGAGAVFDDILDGLASRARRVGEPVRIQSPRVDADYLYVAKLGKLEKADEIAAQIEAAARDTAATIRRYGVGRVGIVTFGGNVAPDFGLAVDAMVRGLRSGGSEANLEWAEHDDRRFARLKARLEAIADDVVVNSVRTREATPVTAPGATREAIRLGLYERGGEIEATLLVPHNAGLVPRYRTTIPKAVREALSPARGIAPAMPELTRQGEALAKALFPGEAAVAIPKRFTGARLIVQHGLELGDLPFEAMRLPAADGAAAWVPATGAGLIRLLELPVEAPVVRRVPHVDTLKILLISDPTSNLAAAREEARALRERLKTVIAERRVALVELAAKRATVGTVIETLTNETFDLLHYAGHAFFKSEAPDDSGLVLADGKLTQSHLERVPRLPRLAFVNACEAGRVRADDDEPREAAERPFAGFAGFFIRSGVEAYLGTFWRVRDHAAGEFAGSLYLSLLEGGSVSESVATARRALFEDGRPDWANYVLFGEANMQLIRRPAPRGAVTPGRRTNSR